MNEILKIVLNYEKWRTFCCREVGNVRNCSRSQSRD